MLCNVCTSPHRNAIDDALENGEVQRVVARRYGLNPSSLSRHLSRKHPRAESLAEIGDEPVLPPRGTGYEWIRRQAKARGIPVGELLVFNEQADPFYVGSPSDVRKGEWFKDIWQCYTKKVGGIEALGEEGKRHLRYLHYRCVVGEALWPGENNRKDGRKYENNRKEFDVLMDWSRIARWLGLVDAEMFEDRKNEPPQFNAQNCSWVSDPSLGHIRDDVYVQGLPEWKQWRMPQIDSQVWAPTWNIPTIPEIQGYEDDKYLDQPSMVGIFIEKSTMSSWLDPLCRELSVELYVAGGIQSITNAILFCKRAAELRKPAYLLTICDFDPQGDKMPLFQSRHVEYRLRQKYPDIEIKVKPLALTKDQVERYKLPRSLIRDSNKMKKRFEERKGKGAVELDALEALQPGRLQKIVRKAVLEYRDEGIQQRLADTKAKAEAALRRKWNAKLSPIEERISAERGAAIEIAETFEKRLARLDAELQKKLKPHQQRMEILEQEARGAVGELVSGFVLPERPAPVVAPDKSKYLFDSRRSYFEQREVYRAYSPPPTPERRPRGGLRIPNKSGNDARSSFGRSGL